MIDTWFDSCSPSIDPDSPNAWHGGGYSIPPFQTHSRYFYAPLGEACCGAHFVNLFYQQFHPFPHCDSCARLVLGEASHICWQCRTYFRRYGTGHMQQIVGITPQRYSFLEVRMPDRGPNQRRIFGEVEAQLWREEALQRLQPPILQVLLPQESTCPFWIEVHFRLLGIQNQPRLVNLPTIQMPYYNEEALLPLPETPAQGFRRGLSLYHEIVNVHRDDEGEDEVPPPAADE